MFVEEISLSEDFEFLSNMELSEVTGEVDGQVVVDELVSGLDLGDTDEHVRGRMGGLVHLFNPDFASLDPHLSVVVGHASSNGLGVAISLKNVLLRADLEMLSNAESLEVAVSVESQVESLGETTIVVGLNFDNHVGRGVDALAIALQPDAAFMDPDGSVATTLDHFLVLNSAG